MIRIDISELICDTHAQCITIYDNDIPSEFEIQFIGRFSAVYVLYKDEILSVCLHFFGTHVAPWFLHQSTPDLLDMKRPSLGNMEIFVKINGSKPCCSLSTAL